MSYLGHVTVLLASASTAAWNAIATVAISFSATIVTLSLISGVAGRVRVRREERRIEPSRLDDAIERLDLGAVGDFLWNVAGEASTADVIRRPVLDQRIMSALDVVSSFAGEPPELPGEAPEEAAADISSQQSYANAELRHASNEIEKGQVWTGLARARRELELALVGLTSQEPSSNYKGGLIHVT